MTRAIAIPILLLALGLLAPGCASVPPGARADAEMTPESYPDLFNAARDVLTEYRFTLDRVDAARGVITTAPKRTAGLATPWDREQSTIGQSFEDLAHQHERIARVTFEPADNPTRVGVEVVVQRVRRPHWRIETDAIRMSTHARDPLAIRAGVPTEYREPVSEDRALAARLMHRIIERAGLPVPADDPQPADRG
ncbi:MAG: hypothetical protein LAT64_14470 [Phycisphaerales bacterium]|nr:hypothetical protein [Planctomycetota bacterium]MCH8509953.1 hypothetical protein [Phycisphaerales bacterium]